MATGMLAAPLKLTVCGLPAALSATVSVPVRVPEVVGINVTLMVQLAPAATELPQLLVWAKSPLALMAVILRAALPELLSVTVCGALVVPCAWLPKVRLTGERPATGPLADPVPVRLTVCGLLAAPSVMVRAPVLVPPAVGVKVTVTVQLAPIARLAPQVLLSAKSPPAVTPWIRSGSLLGLLSDKVWEALVVPTA